MSFPHTYFVVVVVPSALVFELVVTIIGLLSWPLRSSSAMVLWRIWYLSPVNFQG
ncbi:hypothetical protein M405DRAFT_835284, partial [Rhizopogon salebrosus TDB-379]